MLKPLSEASGRSLAGVALLRIDVNAADDWRLEAVIPTINYLAEHARKVLVMSHKGRPVPGKRLGALSLAADAQQLAELIDHEVWFISDTTIPEVRKQLAAIPDGVVVVLENIRAFKGEESNSESFVKSLASLGDYYVSDAFPVLHHPAASVTGLPSLLPSYVGMQLAEEIAHLFSLQERVKRPYVVVIGGAKAKDKLGVIKQCIDKADVILVGGASANALLALRGDNVGKSLYEHDEKLLAELKPFVQHKKIVLPVDFVRSGGKILDIGPKTSRLFAKHLAGARTVLWTGPLGMIEHARFAKGSLAVARAIARNKKAFSVTGGGETVTFLKRHKLDRGFTFISTGGGALIDYVSGIPLPGLKALGTRPASPAVKEKSARTALKKAIAQKLSDTPKPIKLAPVYDIFYHDDLDGHASAAVFLDFLRSRGSRIERFIPVQHDVGPSWLAKDALDQLVGGKKRNPSIVVDFPYHPQATFWYDHHPTAFKTPAWEQAFQASDAQRVDASYLSACHLVYDVLMQTYGYQPPARIRDLVRWADVVDGARYADAFQTFALREAALQVSAFISTTSDRLQRAGEPVQPLTWLIDLMASHGIERTARDRRVQDVIVVIREDIKKSLSYYRKQLVLEGIVAIMDATELTTRKLRFGPYYLFPAALFAITISQKSADMFIVQVGANPWKRERNSFNIGGLLTKFNGGGHPDAGAMRLSSRAEVDKAVEYLTSLFNGSTS